MCYVLCCCLSIYAYIALELFLSDFDLNALDHLDEVTQFWTLLYLIIQLAALIILDALCCVVYLRYLTGRVFKKQSLLQNLCLLAFVPAVCETILVSSIILIHVKISHLYIHIHTHVPTCNNIDLSTCFSLIRFDLFY